MTAFTLDEATGKYVHVKTACPHCGAEVDVASSPSGGPAQAMPKTDDLAACYACLNVSVFEVDEASGVVTFRPMTEDETAQFCVAPEMQAQVRQLREALARRIVECLIVRRMPWN